MYKINSKIRKTLLIGALIAISIVISSCATYVMPGPVIPEDFNLIGKYYFEDMDENLFLNIYLYGDGYFYESTYYSDEDELYSEVGTYSFEKENRTVKFFYSGDTAKWNYNATLSNDYMELDSEGDICRKVEDINTISGNYSIEEISNTYVLYYEYDEVTIIELTLNIDGTFKERSIYPESEEVWTERGTYGYSPISGFISFSYDEWEDGDFTGIVHHDEGVIHSIEGDYVLLEILQQQTNDLKNEVNENDA